MKLDHVDRRSFIAAGALAMLPLSGCSGLQVLGEDEIWPAEVGEPREVDNMLVTFTHVSVVESMEVHRQDDAGEPLIEEWVRDGYVYALPWVRIENIGETSISLPSPLGHIVVRYRGARAGYDGARIDAITVGDETHDTYRHNYYAIGRRISPGEVVEGVSTPYRLPEGFDPTEASVILLYGFDRKEHEWMFEKPADE